MESARVAGLEDVDDIAFLAEEARTEIAASKGGELFLLADARRPPYRDSFLSDLESDYREIVLGCIDSVPVGFATWWPIEIAPGTVHAWVPEIFVLAGARGVGVGESVLNLLFDRARLVGAVGIESQVLPGNRHGKNFFERAAMTTRLLRVYSKLGDE